MKFYCANCRKSFPCVTNDPLKEINQHALCHRGQPFIFKRPEIKKEKETAEDFKEGYKSCLMDGDFLEKELFDCFDIGMSEKLVIEKTLEAVRPFMDNHPLKKALEKLLSAGDKDDIEIRNNMTEILSTAITEVVHELREKYDRSRSRRNDKLII